nr:uncharacterized protein CI109_006766 [Kwoniella shandongensis]KAA5524895.1 hypothetical protein CI109_006766 [Kwoniella shandongensis]
MAYGVRTPIVDGNIHRLFTRLLAVHAPQTGPATIKFLWSAAEQLVERLPIGDGIAGNWNQALMELGSQVCKPVSPECNVCPMQSGCKAFSELSASPPAPTKSECSLCAPIPTSTPSDRIPTVMVFPMKKEKKASRVEQETVSVVEWHGAEGQRRWLFAKRPEKGLLAGLFEPPTSPVSVEASALQRLESAISTSSKYVTFSTNDVDALRSTGRSIGSIPHIFSHINMTYHIYHFIITSPSDSPPPIKNKAPSQTLWLDEPRVESANIGTGVKKVWTEIYGAWGKFDSTIKSISMPKSKKFKKDNNKGKVSKDGLVQKTLGDLIGDKLVKKIVMPAMPVRKDIKMTKSTTTVTISDENVEM